MRIDRHLLCFAVFFVAASGLSQIRPAGDGYRFLMKLAKGKTYRFIVETDRLSGTEKMHIDLPMTVKITGQSKGAFTVAVTQGPLKLNGKVSGTASTRSAKIDANGTVLDGGAGPFPTPVMPKRTLKVGEVWSAVAPLGQVAGQVSARYKFRGFTVVKGHRAAEIGISVNSDSQGLSLSGDGDMFLSTDDGLLVRMKMTMLARASGKPGVQAVRLVTSVARN